MQPLTSLARRTVTPGDPRSKATKRRQGEAKWRSSRGNGGWLRWKGSPMPRGGAGLLRSLRLLPQVTRISSLHCIRAWGGHSVVGWCQPGRERPEVGRDALIPRRGYCDHRRLRRGLEMPFVPRYSLLVPCWGSIVEKGLGRGWWGGEQEGKKDSRGFP